MDLTFPDGHPAQRRYLAEDLVRLRRSDEPRRSTAPHRAAKVDPNPHQVEAVIFALGRLREGGCILADEVGLGKTIEAGLVIAQLKAEGARRILLITPKALLGQWRQELFQLFGLETREGSTTKPGAFDGDGVFLINREGAGSEKGHHALTTCAPFDLCVIDEAHEVFAGLYKRYTAAGDYDPGSEHARTAGRVREALGRTPMLLLTATPIQNNLAELWGLVQYVDPLGTLLGDLPTFREVFCGRDDRQLAPGTEEELRSRLKLVLQRTLRRQAQPFLERPFVSREARLFEYVMSPEERALYDDVTAYLLEPGVFAFQGRHRQLLLIGFHRRMASSTRALQASLERIEQRLLGQTLEPDEFEEEDDDDSPPPPQGGGSGRGVTDELTRVRTFITRARKLVDDDGKFRALRTSLSFISTRARAGQGSDRVVIFTESLVTQAWLRERLISSGVVTDDEVTLLSGTNDTPRAKAALERWRAEVAQDGDVPPSTEVAMRLALVHEFKHRSRVFISTEAGAKGLNLQFCNTVVNYDLPWNPQRIEQRIGRCHRYGQQHDVMVVNFLAKDNETQRLTFDILSQKLELFGTVLDASDAVLHRSSGASGEVLVSALGAEFEGELRRIYERARTLDEVQSELRALRDRVEDERRRFEETSARTASVLAERFDEEVQRVFRRHETALPKALDELDGQLLKVVGAHLDAEGKRWTAKRSESGVLVDVDGVTPGPLHLGHELVKAAVESARALTTFPPMTVKATKDLPPGRAELTVVKLSVEGFERVEQLLQVHLPLPAERGEGRGEGPSRAPPSERAEAIQLAVFEAQAELDAAEHHRFERAALQAERFIEDRLLVLRKRRATLTERLEQATQKRDGATGSEAREAAERGLADVQHQLDQLDAAVERLASREDPRFEAHRAHINQRRYAAPRVEELFSVELIIQ